jgi:ribosomal protein S18 acetylase RimI-like enzyme
MDDLVLTKAKTSDSEFAYNTKKAAFKEYIEKAGGWDEKEQRTLHDTRFVSQCYQVIQVDKIDVGYMSVVRQPDCMKLYQMFILPEYQNRGIGAACMKHITKDADTFKLPVRLQVLKVNNRAISFYERLRFKRTGESDTHILMERPPY